MEAFQAYLKEQAEIGTLIVLAEIRGKLALTDHHVDMDMLLLVSVIAFLISRFHRQH